MREGRWVRIVRCLARLAVLAAVAAPAVAGAQPGGRAGTWLSFDRWLVLDEPDAGRYTLGLEPLALTDDPPVGSPGADRPLPGLRFDSTFAEKDRPAFDGLPPGRRLLSLKARASLRLWAGTLTEETELLGYGPPEPADDVPSDETGPRLLRLGLTGAWGRLESGLRFQSVSPGIEKVTGAAVKPDQERLEAWLGVRSGRLRLRATVGELHDNVADDPHRAETRRADAGVTAEWTLPAGSTLGLGVVRGRSEVAGAVRGPARGRRSPTTDFESLVATVYHYGGPTWDLTLSSTYTQSADTGRPARETTFLSHDLSASLRPTPAVTLAPALSVFDDAPGGTGAGSQGVSASLSVAVAPLAGPLDLVLYGGYSRDWTTDDAFDGRTADAAASLVWHLRRSPPTVTLTFETGYDRYLDAASHGGDYETLRALVTLKIAAF
jgi:hypothetical protein